MLAFALISFTLILIAFAAGFWLLRLCGLAGINNLADRFFIAAWIGLLTIGGLLLALAQALPLNRFMFFTMLAVGGVLLFIQRSELLSAMKAVSLGKRAWPGFAGLAIIAGGAGMLTSRDILHVDTGLYVLPQMVWLGEHGLVTGSGLLHHRLGYHSIWIALAAPISDLSHEGQLAAVGGSIASTLFLFQLAHSIGRIVSGRQRIADWFLVFAMLPGLTSVWLLMSIASSSPDIPVWILIVVFAWVLLSDDRRSLAMHAALLAAGAAAIKFSALPLLAIAAYYLLSSGQLMRRNFLVLAGFGVLTLGSVAAANFTSAGCLLFPSPLACLPVDWGVPAGTAAAISRYISQWPMLTGITTSTGEDISLYLQGKMPILDMEQRLVMIAATMTPNERLGLAIVIVTGAVAAIRFGRAALLCYATALLGLIYCIYVPSFRFAAGYVGVLFGLTVAFAVSLVIRLKATNAPHGSPQDVWAFLAASVSLAGLAISGPLDPPRILQLENPAIEGFPAKLKDRLLLPPRSVQFQLLVDPRNPGDGRLAKLEPSTWIESSINNLKFIRPQNGEMCWNVRTPCAPNGEPLHPLKLRDPAKGYAGGFSLAR